MTKIEHCLFLFLKKKCHFFSPPFSLCSTLLSNEHSLLRVAPCKWARSAAVHEFAFSIVAPTEVRKAPVFIPFQRMHRTKMFRRVFPLSLSSSHWRWFMPSPWACIPATNQLASRDLLSAKGGLSQHSQQCSNITSCAHLK